MQTAKWEPLPFKLGTVRTKEQLAEVCRVRAVAYSYHIPEFGETLVNPEPVDTEPGVLNIYVRDKRTNEVIAAARLQNNFFSPLSLADDWPLPGWLQSAASAEITRFAILPGYQDYSGLISKVMVKACYHYCFATQINWIVIGSRKPLVKGYLKLGYRDLDPEGKYFPFKHTGGILHRVLYFDVVAAERNWFDSKNPDYDFMHRVFHPDIELFSSLSGTWTRPRIGSRVGWENASFAPVI
jgi:hypothetical protein